MNKLTKRLTAMMIGCMISMLPAQAADGIETHHLGTSNTMVKITGQARYLLLPVQESNDDAEVNVLVDGKIDKTIFVRLAKSKVDYYVPFDLSGYEGRSVMMNIVTKQDRSSVREVKEDVCWKNMTLSNSFDTSNREKFRPAFHHTPLYGWMNDPNGMVYKDGVWHLYYQYNPYGSKWQNMSWGHSTSTDLIHWQHLPVAIEGDGIGTVFSGSSVVDTRGTAGLGQGTIVSLYTSAGVSQVQSMAYSTDGGNTFSKLPSNPVLTLESEARDPNMFWDEKAGHWVLTLAHPLEHEMLFFTSPDLKTWTLTGQFGKGIGAQGGVWECPDLFKLPVEGTTEEKWVLLCNINPGGPFGGSATQYFIGTFDGRTFVADTDAQGHVPTKWMDFGKDHYATVSWSDAPQGRRTVIGWMSNWQYAAEVPTQQFRSANTLPREAGLFRAPDGEVYLSSSPSPELQALRGSLVQRAGSATIGRRARSYSLPTANDGICELIVDLDGRKSQHIDLEIGNEQGEKVTMRYDTQAHTLTFDRSESGITDFSQDFPVASVSPTFETDHRISLRIFIDRSSIEVFGNNGRFVMTNLVFPNHPYTSLKLSAQGGDAKMTGLKVYAINAR